MSWIDESEIKRIKDLSDEIHGQETHVCKPKVTCYPIKEYDFDNPVELQKELNSMWEKLDKEYMKEYGLVISVSAFKNRKSSASREVSFFNYEF